MSKVFKLREWKPRSVQLLWFIICAIFIILTALTSIVQIELDYVLYHGFPFNVSILNAATCGIIAGIGTLLGILISHDWMKKSKLVKHCYRFGFKLMNWTGVIVDVAIFIGVFFIDYVG